MLKLTHMTFAVPLLLGGCVGQSDSGAEVEREVNRNLDGIESRLHRLESSGASNQAAEESLRDLRRHRDELREVLDQLVTSPDTSVDSTTIALRERLEDLAIRYETANLARFETRELFQGAAESRFEDLDRELAFLEGDIMQNGLVDFFDATVSQLYRLRNDVALLVAETAAASDEDFPTMRNRLARSIATLDIMIAHTTMRVDSVFEDEEGQPVHVLMKLAS